MNASPILPTRRGRGTLPRPRLLAPSRRLGSVRGRRYNEGRRALLGRIPKADPRIKIVQYPHPALRHRILLNFEGQAEGLTTDELIDRIVEQAPAP